MPYLLHRPSSLAARRTAATLAALCFALFCVALHAAELPATPDPPSAPGYTLGPGDLITMSVFGTDTFDQTVRISNSGKVHVRQLGVLHASGSTPKALADKIATNLKERQLLLDPWVDVKIAEYRARPVYILGEVELPGQFVLRQDMYLVDLLTVSAGANDVASETAYLYRRVEADLAAEVPNADDARLGRDEVIPVNLKALLAGEDPASSLRLRGGDVFYVPERRRRKFFVVGDVLHAGAYEILPDQEITVSRAIAMAGGPLKTADARASLLVRQGLEAGGPSRLPIDFRRLIAGKAPDIAVQEDDIIFVPGSSTKTVGLGLLGILPSLAGDAATTTTR